MKYEWNEPYQLIMSIKRDFTKLHNNNTIPHYNFAEWISELNNPYYNAFLEPLQVNQFKDFILIRYGLAEMQQGMWLDSNSIYRQCRSLVIDIRNNEIVLSPFRKFFNLNEVEENKIENIVDEIKSAKCVEITNKLDGSMQSCRYYNDDYFMSGSMALDEENSWRLKDGKSMLTENHKRMIKQNHSITFVFEYISLADSHVVCYNKEDEGLHLIGMIDVETGYEYRYYEIQQISKDYNIQCVDIELISLEEIIELSKEIKSNEKEGWVINIDGHRVKLKCDDYVKLHRMLDVVSSVNVIIQNIADETFGDLVGKIPESHRKRSLEIAKKVFDYVSLVNNQIEEYYKFLPKDSKKDFMIAVDKVYHKELRGYLRAKYLGQEYNLLKSQNGSYKKMKEIEDYETNN